MSYEITKARTDLFAPVSFGGGGDCGGGGCANTQAAVQSGVGNYGAMMGCVGYGSLGAFAGGAIGAAVGCAAGGLIGSVAQGYAMDHRDSARNDPNHYSNRE